MRATGLDVHSRHFRCGYGRTCISNAQIDNVRHIHSQVPVATFAADALQQHCHLLEIFTVNGSSPDGVETIGQTMREQA